jgi:hypothetical protein
MKCKILLISVLFVMTFGTAASFFAQETSSGTAAPDLKRRSDLVGLMRTINTLEVSDLSQYGAYAPWPTLLERHQKQLDEWLASFNPSHEGNVHFGDALEILPGWNLRLHVNTDGQGYLVLLEDANDKEGFAALSDERGIIRQCKWLR